MVFHVEVLFQLIPALVCQGKRQTWYNSTLASRRKRLTAHFEDLEQCYFSNKMSRITGNYEDEPREAFSGGVFSVRQVWSGKRTDSGTGTLDWVWMWDWVFGPGLELSQGLGLFLGQGLGHSLGQKHLTGSGSGSVWVWRLS